MPALHPQALWPLPHPYSQGLGCCAQGQLWWPCNLGAVGGERGKLWGKAGSSIVIIFHPSFISAATFSLRSLLEVVLCPAMIFADPSPGPLTWLFYLPDLPGFVARGFSGNDRASVGSDSHHQTCSIFILGYCGTVPWSVRMLTCLACVHPQLLPPLHVFSSLLLLLKK